MALGGREEVRVGYCKGLQRWVGFWTAGARLGAGVFPCPVGPAVASGPLSAHGKYSCEPEDGQIGQTGSVWLFAGGREIRISSLELAKLYSSRAYLKSLTGTGVLEQEIGDGSRVLEVAELARAQRLDGRSSTFELLIRRDRHRKDHHRERQCCVAQAARALIREGDLMFRATC